MRARTRSTSRWRCFRFLRRFILLFQPLGDFFSPAEKWRARTRAHSPWQVYHTSEHLHYKITNVHMSLAARNNYNASAPVCLTTHYRLLCCTRCLIFSSASLSSRSKASFTVSDLSSGRRTESRSASLRRREGSSTSSSPAVRICLVCS